MKIQEASENITSWRNYVPSPKINLKEENTKKNKEKGKNDTEGRGHAPRCICPKINDSFRTWQFNMKANVVSESLLN